MQRTLKMSTKQHHHQGISRRALIRSLVYSSIALTGSVAYAQSDNLEIIKADVKVKGLPNALYGFSIGVMADFHAGAWGNDGVIADAISSMRQLQPDIITLLGDYVDGAGSHNEHNINKGSFLFKQLQSLNPPLGTYAVLGNHDHWTNKAEVTALLSKSNVTVLNNENKTLANGLTIAGVDDYWEGPSDHVRALAGVDNANPTILLSHNPDINGFLDTDSPVKLVLSGHTHGGQVRIPFTGWAPWVPCSPRYRGKTGLFSETDRRWCFISKGIGSFLLPVRLSCPPDIALLRLTAA